MSYRANKKPRTIMTPLPSVGGRGIIKTASVKAVFLNVAKCNSLSSLECDNGNREYDKAKLNQTEIENDAFCTGLWN